MAMQDTRAGLTRFLDHSVGQQVELEILGRFILKGTLAAYDDARVNLTDVVLEANEQAVAFPCYTLDVKHISNYSPNRFVFPYNLAFRKITPVNGFDISSPDNAGQNNYAWSMAELGDYIYVGTARNIPYSILSSGLFGNIPLPAALVPQAVDNTGEIWRYKKDGTAGWQQVYKAPIASSNIGFRYMITYNNALYAGAITPASPELLLLKSIDGETWTPLVSDIQGYATRAIVVHQGRLYMGALPLTGVAEAQLFTTTDPELGWEKVNLAGNADSNPQGNIDLLLSCNEQLYVATALPTGFELWRTNNTLPQVNDWKLVVDKGAGDARNEHPSSLAVFNGHIYIGTAIEAAILSISPDAPLVAPKGFDVIRVAPDDSWELIVGGIPVSPTEPVTGTRGLPLSGYPSGFGDLTNGYCWQIQAFDDKLYLGTWSWNNLIPQIISVIPDVVESLLPANTADSITQFLRLIFSAYLIKALYIIGYRSLGCDLWESNDGILWLPVSLNGLGNPYNYGVSNLFAASDQKLYLGTANPFQGCEVWVKNAQ
ncbi:hypothetical protein [Sporomusa termitida]|uniref:Uncharacterized protein n=1 Tax=Sporomusa termitida TaxID=2377 RepID=A0A517DZ31_9FIRM|nr:hypothetical protein [Sporomusa termitida]QDR82602.1 hypothetical protein SPTER_40300 [Sporomusa termitida]